MPKARTTNELIALIINVTNINVKVVEIVNPGMKYIATFNIIILITMLNIPSVSQIKGFKINPTTGLMK